MTLTLHKIQVHSLHR